jgi:hypothetical protein
VAAISSVHVYRADEAIRRTIEWEQANPPTDATFHQFAYPEEDAALNS